MPDLFDLSGKVAVVTGSTRGIGRGIATAMIAAGALVVVSCKEPAKTATVAGELGVPGLACDVCDTGAQAGLINGVIAALGGIDILVCNAGITGHAGSHDLADFDRVMAVNLRAMVELMHIALPHIAERGGGSVILIGSIAGLRGNAAINAYALAKASAAQLARNIAVHWASRNVRAHAIAPGLIRTEFSAALLADTGFMTRRMAMTPFRRPGEVHEIAGTAVYLASAAGAFVTGQTLIVDGGTLNTDGS